MFARLRTRALLPLCGLTLIALFAGPPSWAADADKGKADAKLYQGLLHSTVWVNLVKKTDNPGKVEFVSGTGALVDAKRKLIVTNYHVVRDKDEALVQFPAFEKDTLVTDRQFYTDRILRESIPGKVVARVKSHDLAVIELETLPPGAQALHLASREVRLGERVHFLGNPGDSTQLWVFHDAAVRLVNAELIHSKTNDGFENEVDSRVIVTDTPTRPGESGGPLVNERGELVGVTHGHRVEQVGTKETDLGIFIDLPEVKSLLESKTLLAKASPHEPPASVGEPAKSPADKSTADKPAPRAEEDPEETAARRLKLARSLAKDGLIDRARERYKEIVKQFPRTKAAAEAKELLAKPDP
jgi:S1-C subfamily serine protease